VASAEAGGVIEDSGSSTIAFAGSGSGSGRVGAAGADGIPIAASVLALSTIM
jgi:hypothetical protein